MSADSPLLFVMLSTVNSSAMVGWMPIVETNDSYVAPRRSALQEGKDGETGVGAMTRHPSSFTAIPDTHHAQPCVISPAWGLKMWSPTTRLLSAYSTDSTGYIGHGWAATHDATHLVHDELCVALIRRPVLPNGPLKRS